MNPSEMLRNAAELLDPTHGTADITERFCAAYALVETVHASMLETIEKASSIVKGEHLHAAEKREEQGGD